MKAKKMWLEIQQDTRRGSTLNAGGGCCVWRSSRQGSASASAAEALPRPGGNHALNLNLLSEVSERRDGVRVQWTEGGRDRKGVRVEHPFRSFGCEEGVGWGVGRAGQAPSGPHFPAADTPEWEGGDKKGYLWDPLHLIFRITLEQSYVKRNT